MEAVEPEFALTVLVLSKAAAVPFRTAIDRLTAISEALQLYQAGRLNEAERLSRRVLAVDPRHADGLHLLGMVLREQGRLDEAVFYLRKGLDLQPDLGWANLNLGSVLREQNRLNEAIASYRRAIALELDFPDAHVALAMGLLARGDMAEGWEEYEWRWKMPHIIKAHRNFTQPQWRGEAAKGRTLLMWAEQGFGDTLQFCRYAGRAAARGLRVIMEVPKQLVRLLRSLPGVDQVLGHGEELPAFDFHCPMLSMPLALKTTITTIPSATCYLHADEVQSAVWRTRLASIANPGPRIGLAWAGNPQLGLGNSQIGLDNSQIHSPDVATIDRRRSLPPDRLAPLLEVPGLHFVSLQKGGTAAPAGFCLTDFMHEMDDFADTAALIANLDLVISVDTAIAHLAAAVGKPVWMLDRFDSCWRWQVGRRDSPWYPSLCLYRQPYPGDWNPVLAEIACDLRRVREIRSPSAGAPSADLRRYDRKVTSSR